jgi:uncharacterized protein (DUF2384 family)
MAVKQSFEQGPLQQRSDRFSLENRRHLSAPAIRTFVAIADLWGLSGEQRRSVLGYPSRSAYYSWRRKAREHHSLTLSVDVLMRISAVFGIHAALRELFTTEREACGWLRGPHQAPPFDGQQPLDLIVSGAFDGILHVRRFLDGARGGLYMPPNAIDAAFEPYKESEIVIQEARADDTTGDRGTPPDAVRAAAEHERMAHRISLRFSKADIELIERAAHLLGQSRPAFVREAAFRAAERVLAEEPRVRPTRTPED